jgi:hypothetical protein
VRRWLTAHTHSGMAEGTELSIDQMPEHTHIIGSQDAFPGGEVQRGVDNAGNGEPYTTSPQGDSQPHDHDLDIEASSNIPPYYALYYICYVGI